MTTRGILIAIVFLMTSWAGAREPAGDDHHLVVLVSMQDCCPDEAWPEAERAARAEFGGIDLPVEVVSCRARDEGDRRRALERAALDHGAVCAFCIVRAQRGSDVEIWLNDRITGKTTFRLLHTDGKPEPEEARLTALRLVEALRASLLEFSHPPRPDERVSYRDIEGGVQSYSRKPLVRPGSFGLRAGAGLVGSPGGTGMQGAAQICVRWEAFDPFAFELDGLFTFAGDDIGQQGMRSAFDLGAVRAWALWNPLREGTWRPSLGLGAGVVIPWAEAVEANDLLIQSDQTAVAYLGATAQLASELTSWLHFRLDLRAGLLLPEVQVIIAGTTEATFGRPMVEGFASLEVRLP